jgi:hypothetical protein
MNILQKLNNNRVLLNIILGVAGIAVLGLFAGCAGKYGSLKGDAEVKQAFESNQVPSDYKYYYYGDSEPYVIFGIEPKYEMDSRMWRDMAPDTEEFKEAIRFMWEDYGYYRFGADILDPDGNKVGIFYSSVRETAFKFVGDNQIVVMPNTPFLWGPTAGSGGGVRSR